MVEFVLSLFSQIVGEVIFAALAIVASLVALRYRHLINKFRVGRKTTSPDGKRTAIEANNEIYVTGHGRTTNLTHSPAYDTQPVWSPDGRLIAFQSNRDGGDWNVWVANVDTRKLVQVTRIIGKERVIGWDMLGNLHIDLGGSRLMVKAEELERKLLK